MSRTMNGAPKEPVEQLAELDHAPARRILVVDDSRLQRRILLASLKRWGFEVSEAESGPQAIELCRKIQPDIVISDWMMPGMNGPEFCAEFRKMARESYGYFILLTSKSESNEVAHGLDAGADDFLTKPVSGDELRARLNAGERILKMQRELVEKNRLVSSTLSELQVLYDSLDSDLIEARKLQQSLVKERYRRFGDSQVSLLLRPSGHVGGDLVGFFPINSERVGVFAIDVSGHGVASALMTARLAGYLSSASPEQNIALFETEDGTYGMHPPEEVAAEMNRLILAELETETYFTMLLADIHLRTGDVHLVQAGHPHPAVMRANGQVEFVGDGGPPVGLLPDAPYECSSVRLAPGDRFFVVSDGVTECETPDGDMLENEGLQKMLARSARLSGQDFLSALTWDLERFAGDAEFTDDVSAVLFEFGSRPTGV